MYSPSHKNKLNLAEVKGNQTTQYAINKAKSRANFDAVLPKITITEGCVLQFKLGNKKDVADALMQALAYQYGMI